VSNQEAAWPSLRIMGVDNPQGCVTTQIIKRTWVSFIKGTGKSTPIWPSEKIAVADLGQLAALAEKRQGSGPRRPATRWLTARPVEDFSEWPRIGVIAGTFE